MVELDESGADATEETKETEEVIEVKEEEMLLPPEDDQAVPGEVAEIGDPEEAIAKTARPSRCGRRSS